MPEVSAAERAGTPDEVGTVGALLMGSDGAFITGSDFLVDGGVTAAYWFGDLAPERRVEDAPASRGSPRAGMGTDMPTSMASDYSGRDAAIAISTYTTVLRRPRVPHELFATYWRDVHGALRARIPGLAWYPRGISTGSRTLTCGRRSRASARSQTTSWTGASRSGSAPRRTRRPSTSRDRSCSRTSRTCSPPRSHMHSRMG